jgi:ABC-2 type transport system permease protein
MTRYFKLYRSFVVNCLSRTMEFRGQFIAGIFAYTVWAGVSLLFIGAVFRDVEAVRGWTRAEMWVLYGTFVVLESLCYGLIGPNMWRFSGSVRDGTLDVALTKPVNTQFWVSARYIDPNGVLNCIPGLALLFYGLHQIGRWPSAVEWLLWFGLLTCAFLMAYSIWFGFVTWSIWAVKLEAIAVVFDPMMQMARFPVDLYPNRWLTFLTFILPIAFLTTFPAQALLGRADLKVLWMAPLLALMMLVLCSRFFRFALRHYGSASS